MLSLRINSIKAQREGEKAKEKPRLLYGELLVFRGKAKEE